MKKVNKSFVPDPDNLARILAVARRRLLAAVTPRDRCLSALALMVIELYQKNQAELGAGEGEAQDGPTD